MSFHLERLNLEEGYCTRFPNAYVWCHRGFHCYACDLADRLRENVPENVALFSYRDACPTTPSGVRQWADLPVILSPEAMDRLGLKKILLNQIVIAELSPGCLHQNPHGEIDCFLFADPTKKMIVNRSECFGVPNTRAVERFDKIYFLNLHKYIKKR